MGDGAAGATGGNGVNKSHVLFDNFVQASTFKGTLKAFQELCEHLEVKPTESRIFYHKLKSKLNYWKAKALWAKLDKRAGQKEYKKGRACANSKCLIIGAGPCGLRTAIELAFLGAKVVLLEKRDAFSRNNVLHLWPFTIQDLRGLGAKKFYGKFCAGAIDHISIRQLQLMLLKVSLLLGIEIHVNAEFKGLIEPPEDQEGEGKNERRLNMWIGWRAEVHPRTHPVNELEFDVIIGADGRRNTLPGFRRKEFRGKLAIAITANFINRNTTAEAKVEEISGVAFIFNQKFFQDLREATGLRRHRDAAVQGERGPGRAALLCPRGCRLLHQPTAAQAGLRHQPLRPARRSHVRLYLHVRLRERRHGAPAQRPQVAGGACR
uniref:Microtubule associated monooxygenase, calponin and LIM domain containing 3a n=1 Tax=Labrus bergylta TaxID=56723 RepID=A0A3Q3E2S5_9LABR